AGSRVPRAAGAGARGGDRPRVRPPALPAPHGRPPARGRDRRRRGGDPRRLAADGGRGRGRNAAVTVTDTLAAAVASLCGDLSSIRAPRGSELSARSWSTEAPLRMLLNNLDREVAERPEELIVYGGSGRAARSHEALRAIVRSLLRLGDEETLLVQSGKPVGVFHTHPGAPRVLIANALLVP